MAKLTGKQIKALTNVLYHLEHADKYIMSDAVAVAHRGRMSTTTADYVRASDGTILYEVARDIGSNLTGLREGIKQLRQFIDEADAIHNLIESMILWDILE